MFVSGLGVIIFFWNVRGRATKEKSQALCEDQHKSKAIISVEKTVAGRFGHRQELLNR